MRRLQKFQALQRTEGFLGEITELADGLSRSRCPGEVGRWRISERISKKPSRVGRFSVASSWRRSRFEANVVFLNHDSQNRLFRHRLVIESAARLDSRDLYFVILYPVFSMYRDVLIQKATENLPLASRRLRVRRNRRVDVRISEYPLLAQTVKSTINYVKFGNIQLYEIKLRKILPDCRYGVLIIWECVVEMRGEVKAGGHSRWTQQMEWYRRWYI